MLASLMLTLRNYYDPSARAHDAALASKLQADVQAFLAKGNHIEHVNGTAVARTPKKRSGRKPSAALLARNAQIWEEYLRGDKLDDIAARHGFAGRDGPDGVITTEAKRRGVERPRRNKRS